MRSGTLARSHGGSCARSLASSQPRTLGSKIHETRASVQAGGIESDGPSGDDLGVGGSGMRTNTQRQPSLPAHRTRSAGCSFVRLSQQLLLSTIAWPCECEEELPKSPLQRQTRKLRLPGTCRPRVIRITTRSRGSGKTVTYATNARVASGDVNPMVAKAGLRQSDSRGPRAVRPGARGRARVPSSPTPQTDQGQFVGERSC